ncbi:hypothetical protein [Cyclobacterium sp. SYSU L10401]|uniref:hypothetical protein n=1 Tax=Cyclobacterium sp. SYSU L10401 TaxID=2678657 RepID=UPI0013D1EB4C|nr:hypothetical protein [Cyclobacterium sp. SYSU L10401]
MKTIAAHLPIVLLYLDNPSGNEKVKGKLESIYEWLECKLTRTTGHDRLDQLRSTPGDTQVKEQWKMILQEAFSEDDLFREELDANLDEGIGLIQRNDPEWYHSHLKNQQKSSLEMG